MTENTNRITGRLSLRQPPSRETAHSSAELLKNGSTRSEDLIHILSNDPMSAVNVLKRANQSYYGLRETIGSLSHAIEILGLTTCLRMLSGPNENVTTSPASDAVIRHARATAKISHRLATGSWLFKDVAPGRPGLVFTAGLLHSIGRLALCDSFPIETESLYGYSEYTFPVTGDKQDLERLQFGIDYTEVGEFIGRKMHFPTELIDSIRSHSDPLRFPKASSSRRLSLIVGSASILADLAGYGMEPQVSFTYTGDNSVLSTFQEEVALTPTAIETVLDELDKQSQSNSKKRMARSQVSDRSPRAGRESGSDAHQRKTTSSGISSR